MIIGIVAGLFELAICVFIAASIRSKVQKSNLIKRQDADATAN